MANPTLEEKSRKLRIDIIRMLGEAGSGHPGGSLSCIDILNVLYNRIMAHDPARPDWDGRDRFVLSKAHACPALYAVLADCGYFPASDLMTLRKFGSPLQGHPYMYKTRGLDVSGGSLGQGLSVAVGMALAAKCDGRSNRVYCVMGDGEQEEGEIWEAAMSGAHYRLDNLCAVVDHNHLQIDGRVENVMNIDSISDKWRAFGWNTLLVDGHDLAAIEAAFTLAKSHKGQPTVLIAETVKGKGVSFMENESAWHGVTPNAVEVNRALSELGAEGE